MALHDQAMLASLSISQWDARKFDRKATKEVETTHQATKAGRFNKLLIDDTALQPIAKVAGAMRRHHDNVTLAWGNNGERLLPSKHYMAYTKAMRDFKAEFAREVANFAAIYPGLVQSARRQLGTLYDPGDYPAANDVVRKFDVSYSFMPVPSAKDFRVDVAAEDVEQIRADIAKKIHERQAGALEDIHARTKLYVTRVRDTLSAEKPRIFDSLMENVSELVGMLPAFNIMGDPEVEKLQADLAALVHPVAMLKARPEVRAKVAGMAAAVLRRHGWE